MKNWQTRVITLFVTVVLLWQCQLTAVSASPVRLHRVDLPSHPFHQVGLGIDNPFSGASGTPPDETKPFFGGFAR
ncbi:hypothetical protein BC629DRAFT_1478900 [Irpex lacteus]|nr:hypothetical protein BC629DRAFT_1478900 [Irpex lacteus]